MPSWIRFSGLCIAWVAIAIGIIALYMLSIGLGMTAFCMLAPTVGLWSLTVLIPLGLASAAAMFLSVGRAFEWVSQYVD